MNHFLQHLVAPLNKVLFVFGSDKVSWAELLGFLTGALGVWLTVRARIWNFPIGLANNVFFFVLFWTAKLYADAVLQIVYFALGVYGWWQWLHGGERRSRRTMAHAGRGMLVAVLIFVVPATWVLTVVLQRADDVAPFWDALTTALSLGAQWLLNLKLFENWFFWMAADVVYIPLYFVKSLYLTGIVYVVFLGLCGLGLQTWHRQLASPPRTSAVETAPAGAR
ncbi:MAG: nicotinamide mononucleotide transporter [Catenulispora sp.]|nr:nicotinamide mononucleotide transporter [Catenulispora sp.]